MALVKLPASAPSVVLLRQFSIVNDALVLQHTPLTITAEPPLDVILPPQEAVNSVIEVTVDVVKTGIVYEGIVTSTMASGFLQLYVRRINRLIITVVQIRLVFLFFIAAKF